MVSDMLSENNECNGSVCDDYCDKIGKVEVLEAAESVHECELMRINVKECVQTDAAFPKGCDRGEVDHLECIKVSCHTDKGEDSGYCVSCENADDEGDKADLLVTVCGCDHSDCEGNESADKANVWRSNACAALGHISNSVLSERKTDDSYCRADNNGRHDLVDPRYAAKLNDKSNDNVNETCNSRTDDKSEVAKSYCSRTCKGSGHRADECKG